MSGLGQLQSAAMLSAWRLLLDANPSPGDPFFENTDLNVSSYRKQSLNTAKPKRQSPAKSGHYESNSLRTELKYHSEAATSDIVTINPVVRSSGKTNCGS
jgi:hypothetical protein